MRPQFIFHAKNNQWLTGSLDSIHRSSVLLSTPNIRAGYPLVLPHIALSPLSPFLHRPNWHPTCNLRSPFLKVSLLLCPIASNVAFTPLIIDISFWCLGLLSAINNWHIHSVPTISAALDVIVVQQCSVGSAIPNF